MAKNLLRPSVRPSVRPSRQLPSIGAGGERGVMAPSLATDDVRTDLRPPFPWFGGKFRAAHLIWPRFGNVPNYIEPFVGGMAVPLARPEGWPARVETVNDRDCYLANFWRAVQADPHGVAAYADGPVNEADLHARHRWLVESSRERVERVMTEPDFYDVQIAGWWVWGQCLWIGSGWCAMPGWTGRANGRRSAGVENQRPDLTAANGRGEALTSQHRWKKRPDARRGGGKGVHQKRFTAGGHGGGNGINKPSLHRQKPQLSGDGSAEQRGVLSRADGIYDYMVALSNRLRRVRVCCGDWQRVLTPAVTTCIGLTGVLLDPPYDHAERTICYSQDENVSAAVRAWALEHGDDPQLRIALCGYEGEHDMPANWECVEWKANGGYARTDHAKENRNRERIWFSRLVSGRPMACRSTPLIVPH